jgi:hypothetical protein
VSEPIDRRFKAAKNRSYKTLLSSFGVLLTLMDSLPDLDARPRNAAAIISSCLPLPTIERNPEPSYAEDNVAGVEEDRTNNVRTRIAVATLSGSIRHKIYKEQKIDSISVL